MKAKKRLKSGFLCFLFLLLCGCPYESRFPLVEASQGEVDPCLLGTWQTTHQGETVIISIVQFNERELLILGKEQGKDNWDAIRGYVTTINGERFLNLQEVEGEFAKRGWWFVRYRSEGENLRTWTVDDKLFVNPPASSRQLYRFVKKNIYNADLYGNAEPTLLRRLGQ